MRSKSSWDAACSRSTWVSSISRLSTGAKKGPWGCFSPPPWDRDICTAREHTPLPTATRYSKPPRLHRFQFQFWFQPQARVHLEMSSEASCRPHPQRLGTLDGGNPSRSNIEMSANQNPTLLHHLPAIWLRLWRDPFVLPPLGQQTRRVLNTRTVK